MKYWLSITLGSVISVAVLWWTSLPLGIPGEWTWDRARIEPDFAWNVCGGTVAAILMICFVRQGWARLSTFSGRPLQRFETAAWLACLVVASFSWLWIVQEISPARNRLGKAPFVLYYASSSGYFTKARYEEPDAARLLAGYETLMKQGDVLHTGTHPPGLFLAFQAMISVCESSPLLSATLDQTQPPSVREAFDVIAANARRRPNPRQVLPLDRRVIWLATLIVMCSASLTVIPLYGLLRQTCPAETAWIGASLWPALPAVAIFIPKSDTFFPLIGVTILWLWITAWNRRSLVAGLLAGIVTWLGLVCSLAFLPVLLAAALLTIGSGLFELICDRVSIAAAQQATCELPMSSRREFDFRRCLCVIAASLGFAVPTWMMWHFAECNLCIVWWLNYHNHAGFYQQFPRTLWKWLLANPIELSVAAGWPIAIVALITSWKTLGWNRSGDPGNRRNIATVAATIVFVWGLLWLSGKNSSEAARLWVVFLPWLIWLASIGLDELANKTSNLKHRERQLLAFLAIQFMVCLLTVARVSGFHSDSN